jgi:ABC-type dipeptide/oligopeptide/nickel transport system permease subunit
MTKNVTFHLTDCRAHGAELVYVFTNELETLRIARVSAFPSLALAIALTYVIGDLFRPHLSQPFSAIVDIVLCIVIYKITNHYLRKLRD